MVFSPVLFFQKVISILPLPEFCNLSTQTFPRHLTLIMWIFNNQTILLFKLDGWHHDPQFAVSGTTQIFPAKSCRPPAESVHTRFCQNTVPFECILMSETVPMVLGQWYPFPREVRTDLRLTALRRHAQFN